jgi:hypothetical protein
MKIDGWRAIATATDTPNDACESVKFPQLHRSSLLAHELPGQSALEEACYWRRGSWRAAARRPSTQGKPLTELTRRDETLREIRLSTLSGFMGIFSSSLFICFFSPIHPPWRRHKLKRSLDEKAAGLKWSRPTDSAGKHTDDGAFICGAKCISLAKHGERCSAFFRSRAFSSRLKSE